VVGIDVSDSMLSEARRNCERFGLRNVTLVRSDDTLSALEGEFDLLHSYIVFQHIPTERGTAIFRALLGHLAPGGVAALHVTYDAPPPPPPPSRWRSLLAPMRSRLGRLRQRLTAPGRPTAQEPRMEMNPYSLNALFAAAQRAGAASLYADFTDHGVLGVKLYFQRRAA
jgi:hypothetical protein